MICTVPAGCVRTVSNVQAPTPSNAFGDEAFRMVPVPNEDDSILGRVVKEEPGTVISFEAEARPNPCAQHLEPMREDALKQEIHQAKELGGSVEARATLEGIGFSASTQTDTHLVFDISTTRKIVRRDTSEYLACCRSHDCGFGYISTLVYGQGEYASGRATRVEAEADYLRLAGVGGTVNVAATERKRVEGWVAAVVTPHEVIRNMDETRSRAFVAGGASSFALGVTGLASMAGFMVRATQLGEDRREARGNPDELSEKILTANRTAIATGVLGGLFTATGITLLAIGVRGRQPKKFALRPGVGGAQVEVRF